MINKLIELTEHANGIEMNENLEKGLVSFLEAFDTEDIIYVFTEWLKRNASAQHGRDLYWLIQETKVYTPAIYPTSEFDCETDEIVDAEWNEAIKEAHKRLEDNNSLRPFREMVWDTIYQVLEEKDFDWFLG